MKLKARWIWNKQKDYHDYNRTIIARKTFSLGKISNAIMAVTADSFYRLFINDAWVNDGPCRSWPEHFQYDEMDVTAYLREGENEIRIIARYFGLGTFHQVPRQAGLLVQLEALGPDGKKKTICSDGTWEAAGARAWIPNTVRISAQMEPFEMYDARLEKNLKFSPAAELFDWNRGPWKDLNPRDCGLLTRKPVSFKSFMEANVVERDWLCFVFPFGRLLHPGLVEDNGHVCCAAAAATIIEAGTKMKLNLENCGLEIAVNGRQGKNGQFELKPGPNLLLAVSRRPFGHDMKEPWVRFVQTTGFKLVNPLKREYENPWCFVPFEEAKFIMNDLEIRFFPRENKEAFEKGFHEKSERMRREIRDPDSFKKFLGGKARNLPRARMLMDEPHLQFVARRIIGDAEGLVRNPGALIHDNAELTTVTPARGGDVELVYDLGEQNIGCYDFELSGPEGLVVDIFGIEFIARDGRLQHTGDNTNGVRYVCRDGINRFTSLKRRSGRYIYVTLRNQKKPVKIRKIQLIESTYPVDCQGSFYCSDSDMDRLWEISARTLKLCMEDTFTDCPLYEQTLWVGDARNEAVFAYTAFGAADMGRRCLRLAGESLERYPIVGCQVPSSWDTLIPAWSFLWGLAVWDYYFFSGDKAFLKKAWPWVVDNIEGAEGFISDHGLFSAPFWNLFDWADIDYGHRTVVHDSMLLAGAIDAAVKCGRVLGDKAQLTRLRGLRTRLVRAINRLWDPKKKSYPDSIHEDGTISPSISQHTSLLAILFDIVAPENYKSALKNLLDPPRGMVRIGSPFAVMYLYEALEKAGYPGEIIRSITSSYKPMLDAGATTVWEIFPAYERNNNFPTRSHCHAWSSTPIHFFNRIILGIRQTEPGGKSFEISPWIEDLKWARGSSATIAGPVKVEWKRAGRGLEVKASAPEGVELKFIKNDSHKKLDIQFNASKV